MVTTNDVAEAVFQSLNDRTQDLTFAWPDTQIEPGQAPRPRVEVSFDSVAPQTVSQRGTSRKRFLFGLTCVDDLDSGRDANAQAEVLAELYPVGYSLTVEGTRVWVSSEPHVHGGFADPDQPEWRVPVVVTFQAIA